MNRYSYSAQAGSSGISEDHFRVQDDQDNRVATCYVEDNARTICVLMNAGLLAPELLAECKIFQSVMQWQTVKDALGPDHATILRNLEATVTKAEGQL